MINNTTAVKHVLIGRRLAIFDDELVKEEEKREMIKQGVLTSDEVDELV